MADYKEMYLHMAREMARAADILLKAQQMCEEMYVEADDAELVCMPAAGGQAAKAQPNGRASAKSGAKSGANS